MYKSFFYLLCFLPGIFMMPTISLAQKPINQIDKFIVVENLLKNDKLAIIATDSLESPLENINGVFQFTVNGFNYPLKFNDGVAITPNKLEKSAFVFIKHLNENGSHGQLYYVLKRDTGINPIKISWILLILIPVVFLIIVMLFRKFLMIAVVALLFFFYFNYKKGLDVSTFFETLIYGIKNLF